MFSKKYPKMSAAKNKKTIVEGKVFDSRKEAAEFIGISLVTLLKRIKDCRYDYNEL